MKQILTNYFESEANDKIEKINKKRKKIENNNKDGMQASIEKLKLLQIECDDIRYKCKRALEILSDEEFFLWLFK